MSLSKTLITKNLLVYGITHAVVDATCIAVIFASIVTNSVEPDYALFLVVLYNVLAFGLQAPFGLLFDNIGKPAIASIIGCGLTAIAAIIFKFSLVAVVLAGLGNALFHIGGGIISLNMNEGKAAIPGIYVAPGAMGLLIGGLVAKNGLYIPWSFVTLLLICSILIYFVESPKIKKTQEKSINISNVELIIIFLLVSISIRSLVGLGVTFPWKSDMNFLFMLTIGVVLGKALGGIIADKYGWIKVTILGLLLSAPLIAFGKDYPLLAIPGVFLFNMTMPVTLVALANIFKGKVGFAFGLTTLALVIGALPTFTEFKLFFDNAFLILGTITLSALILYKSLKSYSDIKMELK